MKPYKPTEISRQTLTQEARVFLPPDAGAPPGSWRRVQLLIPPSPKVLVGVDLEPDALGPNRTYKLTEMCPGQRITFALQPHQKLVGACDINNARFGVIVEYFGGE